MIELRPAQKKILRYRRGKMGISAVPGSGKTFTLAHLAANIITRKVLDDDQEVLIVTLVNSAVDNFSARISQQIIEKGFFPSLGYRVRTLHGLAHDIVRGRPGLVGLDPKFQILEEHEAQRIRQEAVQAWLKGNPGFLDEFIRTDLEERWKKKARRDLIPELVDSIALGFIRSAKDARKSPEQIEAILSGLPDGLELAKMGTAIYHDYQRALKYRGAVDFDDLIDLALKALETDGDYLKRLRRQWPFILEDEAQDSSRLQEAILSTLSGENGNWVRVGDPNQAIYETFTTASPKFLKNFILREDVVRQDLPQSGRSRVSIINLANHLIEWTINAHPLPEARDALSLPLIEPTAADDPQSNPADDPQAIRLISTRYTADQEINLIAESVQRWTNEHPDDTAAVLATTNYRGIELSQELIERGVPVTEILGSTNFTRETANALAMVMKSIADPQNINKLIEMYDAWKQECEVDNLTVRIHETINRLRSYQKVEDYLWPKHGQDWLDQLRPEIEPDIYNEMELFRERVQRWHGAALLPIDQAVMTIAQDLFHKPEALALAHKLALVLHQTQQIHSERRLPILADELIEVAKNERRFIGFSEGNAGFQPEDYKGKVIVSTIHKAKGLEWDRVYLISVNNYDFPGSQGDQFISEPWYLTERLNFQAEALEQLRIALSSDPYEWYQQGAATLKARNDYISERLRLLYVGITRARKELMITWNTGRRKDLGPAVAYSELIKYLRQYQGAGTENAG